MKYRFYAGGVAGSNTYWNKKAVAYGMDRVHYYYRHPTPLGSTPITDQDYEEGCRRVKQANIVLHRLPHQHISLLACIWPAVRDCEAVFAIGNCKTNVANSVTGETAWGVIMAVQIEKPVFFFDQYRGRWMEYEYGDFNCFCYMSSPPVLTERFAGISTQGLREKGMRAIDDVFTKTFGHVNNKD